ncbi:hypothetical protein NY057_05155 [Curtobacterium flaccumfaciens]|uniref:hypothetical protein n=1 Tax=Curtobacterium flaccumfaciens TaxID=2035 RepID=UPI002206F077|nr:hypothetical protein [Curtobacterium flaccumfaciens]UWD83634.1 hypothetical protein NY057_05155 [Curtobacterium flaccumfaciens]
MSDWLYDWLKDMTLPALAGIGGIVVGTGAMVAAFTSNKVAEQALALAKQVRDDEQERDADAARERYRDHLFRTVEPAITAVLDHRAEIMTTFRISYTAESVLRSAVLARLWLALSVAETEDARLVKAAQEALSGALATGYADIVASIEGDIVLTLGMLLSEERDVSGLISRTNGLVAAAVAKRAAGSTPTGGTTGSGV